MQADRPFQVGFVHRLRFTRDAFHPENPAFAEAFEEPQTEDRVTRRRAIIFIDDGVAKATPKLGDRIAEYLAGKARRGVHVPEIRAIETVHGGERAKNSTEVVDQVLSATDRFGIDRKSFVVAIGGGAVLDAVGFAAATAHRGVRLVRLPTTTLAQDDAGMAVKNGINRFGKKNYLGAFAVPWAVVCDELFLTTLTDRAFHCGFSEAVKIACLKDPALLTEIECDAAAIRARDLAKAMPIIQRCAELHACHITDGGDPFELAEARPLDFGHWAAHKIESMTNYAVPHGEAVAIGIALDCQYAALAGLLPQADATRITAALTALGLPTSHESLDRVDELERGIEEFREHLGGRLNITMLTGIGHGVEVHTMDHALIARAAEALRSRRATTMRP